MTNPEEVGRKKVWSIIDDQIKGRVPRLERAERIDLLERLEAGSVWSVDFLMMICLSTALASFGLLQGSTAVVIGAMLVAPLMTPLVGAGFALVQGNVRLFRGSIWAMTLGVLAGLTLAMLIGKIAPGNALSDELIARGKPVMVDLVVAFLLGVAAAYVMSRPKVIAALAGVAIAAALVPPLSTVGIALTRGHPMVAQGAAILLATNLVSIILGGALVFRCMGVQGTLPGVGSPLWVRRTALALILLFTLLTAPLGYRTADKLAEGELSTAVHPISPQLAKSLTDRLKQEPGINLVLAGRPASAVSQARGIDIGIVLSASRPVPRSFKDELTQLVRQVRGKDVAVEIVLLREAWAD